MRNIMERVPDFYYTIGCDCGDSDCDTHLFVDNEGIQLVGTLSLFHHDKADEVWTVRLIREVKWRVKVALSILVKGHYSAQHDLVIQKPEHFRAVGKLFLHAADVLESEKEEK